MQKLNLNTVCQKTPVNFAKPIPGSRDSMKLVLGKLSTKSKNGFYIHDTHSTNKLTTPLYVITARVNGSIPLDFINKYKTRNFANVFVQYHAQKLISNVSPHNNIHCDTFRYMYTDFNNNINLKIIPRYTRFIVDSTSETYEVYNPNIDIVACSNYTEIELLSGSTDIPSVNINNTLNINNGYKNTLNFPNSINNILKQLGFGTAITPEKKYLIEIKQRVFDEEELVYGLIRNGELVGIADDILSSEILASSFNLY